MRSCLAIVALAVASLAPGCGATEDEGSSPRPRPRLSRAARTSAPAPPSTPVDSRSVVTQVYPFSHIRPDVVCGRSESNGWGGPPMDSRFIEFPALDELRAQLATYCEVPGSSLSYQVESNALVINATPGAHEQIALLIREIDTPENASEAQRARGD